MFRSKRTTAATTYQPDPDISAAPSVHFAGALIVVLVIVASCAHVGSPLEGIWRHSGKPAWIEIRFQSGVGGASIARHEENAAAEGLALVTEISPRAGASDAWQGKMYSAEADDFVDVELVLTGEDVLVIFSPDRTGNRVEVLRLLRERSGDL